MGIHILISPLVIQKKNTRTHIDYQSTLRSKHIYARETTVCSIDTFKFMVFKMGKSLLLLGYKTFIFKSPVLTLSHFMAHPFQFWSKPQTINFCHCYQFLLKVEIFSIQIETT